MSTCQIIAIILSSSGGLFEIAGLALVAVGIKRDRERARDYFRPLPRAKPPQRSYPTPASPSPLSPPWAAYPHATGGQITAVVQRIAQLESQIEKVVIKLKQATDAELDKTAAALRKKQVQADEELRSGLRYVLAGSIRDRVWGAILLGIGIVLSVAGSVVGTLA